MQEAGWVKRKVTRRVIRGPIGVQMQTVRPVEIN